MSRLDFVTFYLHGTILLFLEQWSEHNENCILHCDFKVESICLLLNCKLKEVVLSSELAKCLSYMQLCSSASTVDWLHSFFVAVDPGSLYVLQRTYWVLRHNDYPFCGVFFSFFQFKFTEIMTGSLCSPSNWSFSVPRLRTHIERCGLRLEAMWVHCRKQCISKDYVRQWEPTLEYP